MRVLIGCEESQVGAREFRKRGHEAYSCDLLPTRGNPEWHFQKDIKSILRDQAWDLVILHPDCTAMAVSGNRWYGKGMAKHYERIMAVNWAQDLWDIAVSRCGKVALENPVSVIFKYLNAPVQYIQPWMFGHGETKKTGLALHNLPELKPTNIVEGREQRVWRMAPGPTRKRDRSESYLGIMAAMAEQWTIGG